MMAGLVVVLAHCDWTTQPPQEQSLVVETFLETGQPLPALTLRQTQPLSASDSLGPPATGAEATVVLGDRPVSYTESAPGRYVPDTALVVSPRTPWRLTVRWTGTEARAEGLAPPPVKLKEVCVDAPEDPVRAVQVDSLRRDSLDIPADQGYLYPINVTVRWANPPPAVTATYWIRTQLRADASPFPSEVVEFFLEPAEIQREDQFDRRGDARRWQGVYAVPVDSSGAPLPEHDLTTALVRGDTAFASFAQTRTDPDRREPLSNVDGALGVALGVSVDSLTRTIRPGIKTCQESP
jgi:hypothetical protein